MSQNKIIAIGDIHGRSQWKSIVNKEIDADKIIFIGDYFDSFTISYQDQMNNFLDILEYKRNNLDKVILLLGNHDYHYLQGVTESYSGYQSIHRFSIEHEFTTAINEGLFKIVHIDNEYLFVHAGITQFWCVNNGIKKDIDKSINELFKYKPNRFEFTPGNMCNPYGDEPCQSPLWVRIPSLYSNMIGGYKQIIGHTQQSKSNVNMFSDQCIICIDTLELNEYLVIDNNIPEFKII